MLRDNRARARTARLLCLLLALNSLALVVFSLILPPNVNAAAGITRTTALLYAGYSLLGFAYLALLIGSYITLIRWLRRAYYNLHQLPGIYPEYSDGWAAGAWFVPFINLARPYTIVREVWQDTQVAARGRVVEPATVLGWWWAAFILKFVVGRITWAMATATDAGSHITQQDLLATGLDASAQILAALLTWYVIGRCLRFEEELALRQQVEQLGQLAPEALAALQAEQPDYGQAEGY